jgi:GNAT superfamily N-acetyltransferase
MIRLVDEEDYGQLVSLYKQFFPTHNMFQREKEVVEAYLRKEALEREAFVVSETEGLIRGAFILMCTGTNGNGTHTRWKFRHFAFETEKVGRELLEDAETRVRKSSKTAKVELTIADGEEGLEFYAKWGYKKEATLANHYRWEEECFILGKSFG